MSAHFDWRYELRSMWKGMSRDLQQPVGQTVPWYVFDSSTTIVDPIYDVGSNAATGGRRWKAPHPIAVMSAVKLEGQEVTNDRGLYITDVLKLVFSVEAARNAGLSDLVFAPDAHNVDRVVYEHKVFEVNQVRSRGILTADYAVIGVDLYQVSAEELVNDPDFQQYIPTDDGLQQT